MIAEKAGNSHLSDEFFNEVDGQIRYVSRKLGINSIQAVVLALMVNRSFDTRIELNDFIWEFFIFTYGLQVFAGKGTVL